MISSRRYTIRQCLMAFGAALVLPGLVFAAILLWRYASAERHHYEEEALGTAQRIMAAVDRELVGIQSAAQALATSSSLLEGNFEAFQRQAEMTLRSWSRQRTDDYAIVVRDVTGQQVANTRLPWGSPLPKGANLPVDQQVIATKKPVIQDLFTGATAGRPIISIRVPVLKDDTVTHVLSMAIEPRRIAEILLAQNLPASWIATVIDRDDRVVARSRQHEAFVSRPAPDEFLRAAREADGIWEGFNLEGTAVLGAYARSGVSGWTAFVGVPAEIVQAPLHRSLWTLFGFGAALILLSLLLARSFGQRIAIPVQGLVDQAQRLGRGASVAPPPTGLVEVDQVGGALAAASQDLREREAALRGSEARLWATQNNAAVGIAEVDRDGRFVSVNEARCKLTGHTREELIGQHFGHATDAEILNQDLELFTRQVAGELDAYTTDSKFRRKDGSSGWARVTSTAVRDADGTFLYAVRVVEDITERRQADRRQKLLIDELNHRVKNTLATVQSLSWQASRSGAPPQVAQERFQERLLALSRTHNLLNETHWEGASLRAILETELLPYATGASRIRLSGPELRLPPKPAVVLGMAFHELATNAVKYGALSTPSGWVQVDWAIQEQGHEAMLTLEWCELEGPVIEMQPRPGFGSRLLRQTITRELAGHLDIRFEREGVRCTMVVPIEPAERHAA
ncbi:sensor histidine kinase [Microvirga sp. CF3016]|uniref:sensor histidine kinase n=1 Tax=Microvirga sp. CF3016 TaxID=3110181 RepID=UPI002E768F46|nr:HWE histidine kinase domain-containing protein [Microvirga sp. CF3016]MEE1613735.1 HWE histidine kinase domain-containing protein [Microvirga sp. CF3016]